MLLKRKSVNRAHSRSDACYADGRGVKFRRQEASMKSNDRPKKEEKKKPEKTLKEKRAEKKAKKESKSSE
jgi:hypothetical protein